MTQKPLFDIPFLASHWETEYRKFQESGEDSLLLDRLKNWTAGDRLKETSSESSFIKQFFCEIWGYSQEGDTGDGEFQCYPAFLFSQV